MWYCNAQLSPVVKRYLTKASFERGDLGGRNGFVAKSCLGEFGTPLFRDQEVAVVVAVTACVHFHCSGPYNLSRVE